MDKRKISTIKILINHTCQIQCKLNFFNNYINKFNNFIIKILIIKKVTQMYKTVYVHLLINLTCVIFLKYYMNFFIFLIS